MDFILTCIDDMLLYMFYDIQTFELLLYASLYARQLGRWAKRQEAWPQ